MVYSVIGSSDQIAWFRAPRRLGPTLTNEAYVFYQIRLSLLSSPQKHTPVVCTPNNTALSLLGTLNKRIRRSLGARDRGGNKWRQRSVVAVALELLFSYSGLREAGLTSQDTEQRRCQTNI